MTRIVSAEPLIDVQGVAKHYGKRIVLDDVDLRVDPGEVVGLIGPNGAGKSTLIRIISGMSEPSGGVGTVLGMSLRGRSGKVPFLGMMIERPAFIETLSARRNLQLLFGIRGQVHDADVDAILSRVGLDAGDNKPVRAFSLGMRQRLSLAQAIGEHPSLLILDEPTNGLDPSGILEMRELIRGLAKDEGMGVLLASHLLNEVEAVCDRVVMLAHGRVQRTYAAEEVVAGPVVLAVSGVGDLERIARIEAIRIERQLRPLVLEVHLSAEIPHVVRELVSAGVSIEGIHRSTQKLEQMYLEAVRSA